MEKMIVVEKENTRTPWNIDAGRIGTPLDDAVSRNGTPVVTHLDTTPVEVA